MSDNNTLPTGGLLKTVAIVLNWARHKVRNSFVAIAMQLAKMQAKEGVSKWWVQLALCLQ